MPSISNVWFLTPKVRRPPSFGWGSFKPKLISSGPEWFRIPAINMAWRHTLFSFGLVAVALLLFVPTMNTGYYGDDFIGFFFPSPEHVWRDHFFPSAELIASDNAFRWYRPLSRVFMNLAQNRYGLDGTPQHVTTVGLHVLLCFLIYSTIIRLGGSLLQASLAALFMLISQANAMATLGVDMIGQVASTFFGFAALMLEVLAQTSEKERNTLMFRGLAIMSLVVGLLWKENAAIFLPIILVAVWVARLGSERSLSEKILASAPYVIAFAAFLMLYLQFAVEQPVVRSGGTLSVGPHVLRNVAMMCFAALVPRSSVAIYYDVEEGNTLAVALTAIATFSFLLLTVVGLIIKKRRLGIGLAFGCAILALFPAALMRHVSELYVYNAMPFVSCLFGTGWGAMIVAARPRLRAVILFATAVLLAAHVHAFSNKAERVRSQSELAETLMAQIADVARSAPQGATIIVAQHVPRMGYSVFDQEAMLQISRSEPAIRYLSGRADVQLSAHNLALGPIEAVEGAIYLAISGNGMNVRQVSVDGLEVRPEGRSEDSRK